MDYSSHIYCNWGTKMIIRLTFILLLLPLNAHSEFKIWYEDSIKHVSNIDSECIKNNDNGKYVDLLCVGNKSRLEEAKRQEASREILSKNQTSSGNTIVETPKTRTISDTNAAVSSADLDTLANEYIIHAGSNCEELVEKAAAYKVEWTDGFLESKFTHYRWKDSSRRIITFLGDKARAQNGFGAYANIIYTCDFDITTRRFISADLVAGSL